MRRAGSCASNAAFISASSVRTSGGTPVQAVRPKSFGRVVLRRNRGRGSLPRSASTDRRRKTPPRAFLADTRRGNLQSAVSHASPSCSTTQPEPASPGGRLRKSAPCPPRSLFPPLLMAVAAPVLNPRARSGGPPRRQPRAAPRASFPLCLTYLRILCASSRHPVGASRAPSASSGSRVSGVVGSSPRLLLGRTSCSSPSQSTLRVARRGGALSTAGRRTCVSIGLGTCPS